MSILNITNLTNRPEDRIRDNYKAEFEQVIKDNPELEGRMNGDEDLEDYIQGKIDSLIDFMQAIIDNFLVNHDYYTELKEYIEELGDDDEDEESNN